MNTSVFTAHQQHIRRRLGSRPSILPIDDSNHSVQTLLRRGPKYGHPARSCSSGTVIPEKSGGKEPPQSIESGPFRVWMDGPDEQAFPIQEQSVTKERTPFCSWVFLNGTEVGYVGRGQGYGSEEEWRGGSWERLSRGRKVSGGWSCGGPGRLLTRERMRSRSPLLGRPPLPPLSQFSLLGAACSTYLAMLAPPRNLHFGPVLLFIFFSYLTSNSPYKKSYT